MRGIAGFVRQYAHALLTISQLLDYEESSYVLHSTWTSIRSSEFIFPLPKEYDFDAVS